MICENLSVNEKGNLCIGGLDTVDLAKENNYKVTMQKVTE